MMRDVVFPVTGKEKVSEIITHKEDMLLLDSVYSFSSTSLEAGTALGPDNPFFRDGETPSYVCFELIAQAVCVFSYLAGYNGSDEPDIGFILKLSDFKLTRASLAGDERLRIRVDVDCAMGNGLFSFKGSVTAEDGLIASGRLLVMSVPDPEAVIKGRWNE